MDCEEMANFRWCALDENFNVSQVKWGEGQPPLLKAETCVSVVYELGKEPYLEAIDCNSNISFICEVIFRRSFFLILTNPQRFLCQGR
jgi:hypothetical protein